MHRSFVTLSVVGALVVGTPGSVLGTDGHFLHGVGAVNAAMGGVGVAAPTDLLGAFYHNPAGLMAFDGTRIDLGFEMFKPSRTLSSSAGSASGSTESKSDFVPIPAFGWSTMLDNRRVVIGVGAMGVGGFGVDYPADPGNPILAPRPSGFGQMYSNFQMMKIAPSIAFAASERLWLGASVHVDWASLSVDPMPVASPDSDPGSDGIPFTQDDRAFYPRATAADGAFGFGFQVGTVLNLNDIVSFGASYTSRQDFQDFEFNAVVENPSLPSFGSPREVTFALDVPAVLAGGVAMKMLPNLLVAGDVKYYFYEDTDGFEASGFDQTGAVLGFGWTNIVSYAIGAEFLPAERLAIRAGYHRTGNPVPDELSMFNAPAPAIVRDHLTAGLGFQATRRLGVQVAYYHARENRISGPFLTPTGPVPGSNVTSALSEHSVLMQFSFVTRGSVF